MKTALAIVAFLAIVRLSFSALQTDTNPLVCGKYQPINVTSVQLAGVWYIQGYGFDGTNDHPNGECQKRTFAINADGLTGFVETSNVVPGSNQSKTFTSPFFESRPGVFILGQEPGSASVRVLTVLYLDVNILVYYRMALGCGGGDKSSEPRLASRKPEMTHLPDLITIMKGLPTASDFKDYREIPQANCPK